MTGPATESDYAACYSANVVETRAILERAVARFRALRRAGQITPRPEGGYLVEGPEAAKVLGDVVRLTSDMAHWLHRKAEAEQAMRAEAVREPDRRLPPEREPGDDTDSDDGYDDGPIPW